MKKEQLIDLIGEIDDRYIQESEQAPIRFKMRLSAVSAVAACLLVLVLAIVFVPRLLKPDDTPTIPPSNVGDTSANSIAEVFFHQGAACYETVEGDVYLCTEDGRTFKLDIPLRDIYYADSSRIICREGSKGLFLLDLSSGVRKLLSGTAEDQVTSASVYGGRLYYTCAEAFGGKLKSIDLADFSDVREELPAQNIIKVTPCAKGILCIIGKLDPKHTLREDIGLLQTDYIVLTGVALYDGSELRTLLEPEDMGYTFPDSCRLAVEGGRFIFAVNGKHKSAVVGTIE
ncbi:MAG: hypothetical protein IKY46_04585 [Clostridia bacterium]|nr:hypothetical protein [Clostridia bacterium]